MSASKGRQGKSKGENQSVYMAESITAGEISGERWLPWLFVALAATIFGATMCRTVPGGDSGELISVSYNLSVAHPPGYPLYTLLAHLFTYIPFGSVAWRVNLMSAVFGVLSGLMIYLLVARWLKDRWLGVLAAGIFIFSPLAWRYAVVAEVFTLNNFFISALLYISLRFLESPERKWAVLWAACLGLACSHHHTIVFLAIPIFGVLLYRYARLLLEPKVLFPCLGLFLAGFLPYLYLPWAAKSRQLISWGAADTWDGFLTHFLRREYGTFQLATGERNFLNVFSNLKYFSLDIWLQHLYVGVVVGLIGVWYFLKSERRNGFALLLMAGWLFYVLVFHTLANMDLSNRLFYDVQSRFWLLPNIIFAIFMAAGAKVLLGRLGSWRETVKAGVVSLTVAVQIGVHFDAEDHSRNTIFYDLGKSLLDGLPQGSLVFLRGDVYVNSIRYMQSVEGYRKDVIAVPFDLLWWPWMRGVVEHNFPQLKWPGKVYRYRRANLGEFTLRDFFELNYSPDRPSFIGKLADYEVANLGEKFRIIPVGFLNRIVPINQPFDFAQFQRDVAGFAGFGGPSKEEIREKSWEAFIYYNYWDREIEKAKLMFDLGTKEGGSFEMIAFGASIMDRLVREYSEAPPSAYRNLGVAYQIMSRRDSRYLPKMVWAWKEYLKFNPADDPQLALIRQAVESSPTISIVPGAVMGTISTGSGK